MKISLVVFLVFFCNGIYANSSVDLFDNNRGQANKESSNKLRPKKTIKTSTGIDFSLTGISRIGEKYVFYFDTKKGKRDKVTWFKKHQTLAVKIYSHYQIDKLIDRTLYLNITNDTACIENLQRGVSCDKKNNQILMQLVRKNTMTSSPSPKLKHKSVKKNRSNKKRPQFPF